MDFDFNELKTIKEIISNSNNGSVHLSFRLCKNNFEEILEEIKKKKNLKIIDLSNNNLNPECSKLISDYLINHDSLEKLFLNTNRIENEGSNFIFQSLNQNHSLKTLDLSKNQLSDSGLENLQLLSNNTSLLKLELYHNEITSDGIKFLSFISSNKHLKELDLSFNKIDNMGVRNLFKYLKYNKSLTKINLSGNNLNDFVLEKIKKTLKTNNSLTTINLNRKKFQNQILLNEIKDLLQCNLDWDVKIHKNFNENFKKSVFFFCTVLKYFEKRNKIKIPKFVVFEIIKQVDRKSFLFYKKKVN